MKVKKNLTFRFKIEESLELNFTLISLKLGLKSSNPIIESRFKNLAFGKIFCLRKIKIS